MVVEVKSLVLRMKHYLAVWRKFAQFDGRSRRSEYWYFTFINLLIMYVLAHTVTSTLFGLFLLAIIIPLASVSVRRLHDIGHSGWWLLIKLIPLFGSLLFLALMATGSQPEENKYGSNPKMKREDLSETTMPSLT